MNKIFSGYKILVNKVFTENNVFNPEEVNDWRDVLVKNDSIYKHSTIVIAGDVQSGKSTLLNNLLSVYVNERDRVIVVRKQETEIEAWDNMSVVSVTSDHVTQHTIKELMRLKPDVVAYDSDFKPELSDEYDFKNAIGIVTFYIIPATGANAEEIKLNATSTYENLQKSSSHVWLDTIYVTEKTNVNNKDTFTVTEFI